MRTALQWVEIKAHCQQLGVHGTAPRSSEHKLQVSFAAGLDKQSEQT